MIIGIMIVLSVGLLSAAYLLLQQEGFSGSFRRLMALNDHEELLRDRVIQAEINWAESQSALDSIKDRFGKAGLFTTQERDRVRWGRLLFLIGCVLGGFALGAVTTSAKGGFFGALVGLYCAGLGWLYFINSRTRDFQREVMFQLPLTLEALILLVEAGLGVLPAIEQVVAVKDASGKPNPVTRFLRLVYQLSSHGMPFSQALELVSEAADLKVLRHVLLHLDISGSVGGELIPSLRSLSDFTHTEWKLSVETRVKRLENLVVFPVFASVMGLMLLTASVPIVPILKFRESIKTSQSIGGVSSLATDKSQSNGEVVVQ